MSTAKKATSKKSMAKKELPERFTAEAAGIVVDGRIGEDGKLHPATLKNGRISVGKKK